MYKSKREKTDIKRYITKVCDWLYIEHNITVEFGADEENEFDDVDYISICSRANYRSQLHTLLHEAGHAILAKDKRVYKKKFPLSHKEEKYQRSKDARVDVLREEILAWEKGLDIAKMLNIRVNKTWYHHHMRTALWTYVEWAAKTIAQ
jgi:hypothetical protein